MSNTIKFSNAEIATLQVKTAANGKQYISGILIDRNDEGAFVTSEQFRSFTFVEQLATLPKVAEFAALSAEEQKAAKAARPRVNVSGWLKKSSNAKGIWQTTLMVQDITVA